MAIQREIYAELSRLIWRGNCEQLPDQLGEVPDLFGEENLECCQTYLKRIHILGQENLQSYKIYQYDNIQSYQTYLERKTCRSTRSSWKGKHAELQDLCREENTATRSIKRAKHVELQELFGDENLQYYQTYQKKTWRGTRLIQRKTW